MFFRGEKGHWIGKYHANDMTFELGLRNWDPWAWLGLSISSSCCVHSVPIIRALMEWMHEKATEVFFVNPKAKNIYYYYWIIEVISEFQHELPSSFSDFPVDYLSLDLKFCHPSPCLRSLVRVPGGRAAGTNFPLHLFFLGLGPGWVKKTAICRWGSTGGPDLGSYAEMSRHYLDSSEVRSGLGWAFWNLDLE